MNAALERMVYDKVALAISGAVRSFTIQEDAAGAISGTAIGLNPQTSRHLFPGGPGQRYAINLISRTDNMTDADGVLLPSDGLADRLTGLVCTINGTQYRVMAANTTPCGGLVRIALDSVEQVGI